MKYLFKVTVLVALLGVTFSARAAVNVTVDPGASWGGWMNVSELPENGGAYLWGSGWGTADLNATFAGDTAILMPNYSIGRDVPLTDAYWWKPDGTGNKWMEANFYVDGSAPLAPDEAVQFDYTVLSNTLLDPYTSAAFIKFFDAGWGLRGMVTSPLAPGAGMVSLSSSEAIEHYQYGFMTIGPNARLDEMQRLGMVMVTKGGGTPEIPEPGTLALLGLGVLPLIRRRK